jgi:MFS family permease
VLFNAGALDAVTQTLCWCVIFFFASTGASAAYLTVSEIFPVEIRARAIAVFFAIAQSFGAFGPWFYGQLIGNGQDHFRLFIGYLIGAAVMLGGGLVDAFLGVDAERRSLEEVARPLGSTSDQTVAIDHTRPNMAFRAGFLGRPTPVRVAPTGHKMSGPQ